MYETECLWQFYEECILFHCFWTRCHDARDAKKLKLSDKARLLKQEAPTSTRQQEAWEALRKHNLLI